MATQTTRLLLVDDHIVVRVGIRSLLDDQPDMEVVGEAGSGEEALALFPECRPDIVLLDLRLPAMNGIECTAALRALDPHVRVILLTTFDGGENIYRALQAGAKAYVLKDVGPAELLQTIRAVSAGNYQLNPDILRQLAQRLPESDLQPRELEVLRLVSRGRSNKEIGATLGVAESTVKGYLNTILAKLHAHDRTEAVTIALRQGLIAL